MNGSEETKRRTPEQVHAQRVRELRAVRMTLVDGPEDYQVERFWWEPHFVYLLHFPADGVYKVGLTRDKRRPQLLCRGRGFVRETHELANRYAAFVLESSIWLRTNDERCDPPTALYDSGRTEYWRDALSIPSLASVVSELMEDRARPAWDLTVYARH